VEQFGLVPGQEKMVARKIRDGLTGFVQVFSGRGHSGGARLATPIGQASAQNAEVKAVQRLAIGGGESISLFQSRLGENGSIFPGGAQAVERAHGQVPRRQQESSNSGRTG
jgi:hypothetical protein